MSCVLISEWHLLRITFLVIDGTTTHNQTTIIRGCMKTQIIITLIILNAICNINIIKIVIAIKIYGTFQAITTYVIVRLYGNTMIKLIIIISLVSLCI